MNKKLLLGIFAIALIKTVFLSHFGFGLLDEGESLHNATRILNGEVPYRDFFAIFPPLDNYFFAGVFSLFGKSVLMPRLIMSIIFSIGTVFAFLIIKKLTTIRYALLTTLIIIVIELNAERLFFFTPIWL